MSIRSSLHFLLLTCLVCMSAGLAFGQPRPQGPGCTTPTVIDWDCDGYGPGSPLGPDADDNDATVNTSATALARYGTTAAILAHLGYTPTRKLFISTSGNDSTGQPNSESQPYASWNGVAPMIQAGDAVIWRAGTYPDHPYLTVSGTPGNPIILMAYPGERVILDQPANGVEFVSQSNIVLDGLTIQNSANGLGDGIFFGDPAANIVIRGVETRNRYRGILAMNNMSNVLIEHSTFHDTTAEHCIYLGARQNPNSNITVRYNLIYRGAYNGIQHNGRVTNLVVDSNIIHSNVLSGLSFLQGVSYSTVKNNLIFNNGRNCMLIWDYYGDPTENINPYDQTNDTFVNNTCWVGSMDVTGASIAQPAINIDNGGYAVSMDNHKFENNIFVTNNYPVFSFGQAQYLNTTIIRDNVMQNAGGTSYLSYGGSNYGFASLNGWDSLKGGNVSADPVFRAAQTGWYTSPNNFDFTLQSGSPAIGLSIAADAPALDLVLGSRGSAPNAGAFQGTSSGASGGGTGSSVTLVGLTCSVGSLSSLGSSTCTVNLSGPAPVGGVTIAISSNNGLLSVPGSITVPAGASSASFSASAGVVAAAGNALVNAVLGGSSVTASLTLTAPGGGTAAAGLASFGCNAVSLPANGSSTCTIALNAAAPAGGASVQLSSNSASLSVPASVLVSAGSVGASFTVTAGAISSSGTAVITAAVGSTSLTASIRLQASAPPFYSAPVALASLICGSSTLTSQQATSCAARLTGPAPVGGAYMMIFINTGMLAVPGFLVVPPGSTSAAFPVTARFIQVPVNAVITAIYAGGSTAVGLALRN